MKKFEASNGVRLTEHPDGTARIVFPGSRLFSWTRPEEMEALREFFQHERDEELGRWRWPDNPDYVVYPYTFDSPRPGIRGVTVLAEEEPRLLTVWEDNIDTIYGHSNYEDVRSAAREAARGYFEAHPERKPWEDAKEGDVWIVTPSKALSGGERVEYPAIFQAGSFRDHGGSWEARDLTSARRIWPESV